MNSKSIDIGKTRELFLDDFLIAEREGLFFRQHAPVELPAHPEKPCGAYLTLLQDDRRYLMYYRGFDGVFKGECTNGNPGEFYGVAESTDGITWNKPALGLYPDEPVPPETFLRNTPLTHNFVPFYDRNPVCRAEERYKAVSGVRESGGLCSFYSADGIHWNRYSQEPMLPYAPENYGNHMFDSQNVAFYSETEGCYVMYIRVWKTSDGRVGLRSFAKMTSRDFHSWSEPELLNPNMPGEHLYVSGLAPYIRAPHYYVGAATRYFEDRGSATDVTLLFSRRGEGILRPFPGVWIAPGLVPDRWSNRMNYMAWGIACVSDEKMVLYHGHKQLQYELRTDGFISLAADWQGGGFLTKTLAAVPGAQLELNCATSAAGGMRMELCTPDGTPVPGYTFDDFGEFYGDRIAFTPDWQGKKEIPLSQFRLRFRMKECDLYSLVCKGPN